MTILILYDSYNFVFNNLIFFSQQPTADLNKQSFVSSCSKLINKLKAVQNKLQTTKMSTEQHQQTQRIAQDNTIQRTYQDNSCEIVNQDNSCESIPQDNTSESILQDKTFESIYHRRIIQLQQKVNKHCAEYDALMNLLPIGNHLSTVVAFQKEVAQMNSKLDAIDRRVTTANDGDVEIDHRFWQQSYEQLANALKSNEEQLAHVSKVQQQAQNSEDLTKFSSQLQQKLSTHHEIISSKVAHHKNNMALKKHTDSHKHPPQQLSALARQKIHAYYQPILRELDLVEYQLQVQRLKTPLRNLQQFHNFTYHRLIDELLQIDQTIQELAAACNSTQILSGQYLKKQITSIEAQLQSVHYQIEGSRKKCLTDLLLQRYLDNRSHDNPSTEQITNDYNELHTHLHQLRSKLQLLEIQARQH